jgi:hypothetical protein
VTVTKSVAGEATTAFVNWAVICDPLVFTEVLEGCSVRSPGPVRFTTAVDGKFAPRIVSVKLPLPGAVVAGDKLGGDTWVMRGTAFEGAV